MGKKLWNFISDLFTLQSLWSLPIWHKSIAFVTPLILGLIALITGVPWYMSFILVFTGLICFSLLADQGVRFLGWVSKKRSKFSVILEILMSSPDSSGRLPVGVTNGDRLTVSRVAMCFRIMTTQKKVLLETFKVEIQATNGEWVRLERLESDGGVVWFNKDFTEGFLAGKVVPRWLNLDEWWLELQVPLRGWIFYTYGNLEDYTEFTSKFRVTIRDVLNNEETKILSLPPSNPDSVLKKSFVKKEAVDLSKFQLR